MINYVHRLSDPRDPAYPFSDTYVCSKCNERLSLDDSSCDICNLYIYGEIDTPPNTSSTYPEPASNIYLLVVYQNLIAVFLRFPSQELLYTTLRLL